MKSERKSMESILRNVIVGHFPAMRILQVEVEADLDADEDPILRICVVYDPKSGKPDGVRMSGLGRRLLPVLEKRGEPAFPIVSFISEPEYRMLNPEAA